MREKEIAANPPLREVRPGHWVATWSAEGYATAPETLPRVSFRREKAPAAKTVV